MRFALIACCALVAFAPSASTSQPVSPASVQTDAIRQLVGQCRPLAIEAYRSGDMRRLDVYVAQLYRDRPNRQREIIACGAYLVGASDASFYGPDPR